MKNLFYTLTAIACIGLASCQPSKEEMKKKYMETCEKEAGSQGDSVMKKIVHDFCDCSGDKIINHFSTKEIEEFGKMGDAEVQAKIAPVIQACTDDMEKRVMTHSMEGTGMTSDSTVH